MVHSTHYDRLGVARDASPETIASAYRALCRRHHPDLNGGSTQALRMMQDLNESYAVLRDPVKRAAYDRTVSPPRRAVRRRRAPMPAPRRPRFMTRVRRKSGALLQATVLAISLFLAFSPRPALAEAFGIVPAVRS